MTRKETQEVNGAMVNYLIIPAVIKSVRSDIKTNSNGTQYQVASVEITYPDGSKKTTASILYTTSLEMFPDAFAPKSDIELRVQLDGEFKGASQVQLPRMERIDVDLFLEEVQDEVTANA